MVMLAASAPSCMLMLYLLCWYSSLLVSTVTATTSRSSISPILVVGSVNVDLIMEVHRLPEKGETTISRNPNPSVAVGGKGANQAVAAARLVQGSGRKVRFVCRFGDDAYADMLERELVMNGVDVSGCRKVAGTPSGHGMVMLEPDGAASSVVLGGSNLAWREDEPVSHIVAGVGVVLLQREVPEHVNQAIAEAARRAGVAVIQDAGGEERPISDSMLSLIDYLMPNEHELQRLTNMTTDTNEQVIAAAQTLLKRGVHNVIVTLAERGSVLVTAAGNVITQDALPVPGGVVIDGTAAGDAFRAAFAVALVEGWPVQHCLHFAAAAGAVAVARLGAVPSLPSRSEVLELLAETRSDHLTGTSGDTASGTTGGARLSGTKSDPAAAGTCSDPSLSGTHTTNLATNTADAPNAADGRETISRSSRSDSVGQYPCTLKFASRLNSMKARRDLVTADGTTVSRNNVLGWIARQGQVRGLQLVDLNYPQHLEGVTTEQVQDALRSAGLAAGAINIRFPAAPYQSGAFTNPNLKIWQAAVDLAVEGCERAAALGAADLIVWSPYDGYDYHLQVDYDAAWNLTVEAFRGLADNCPAGIRVSLEFKPTDENTRYSIVPSTGAALLLAGHVNRPNFGLTLDVGHLMMMGENPAQSVAMVAAAGRLFGMHLNDAHMKLGAEDGLAFGSVNPIMALEVVYQLQRVNYSGHMYFDTFPLNEDPVREAEYNIRQFKRMWLQAANLVKSGLPEFSRKHDAMSVLELLESYEFVQPGDSTSPL